MARYLQRYSLRNSTQFLWKGIILYRHTDFCSLPVGICLKEEQTLAIGMVNNSNKINTRFLFVMLCGNGWQGWQTCTDAHLTFDCTGADHDSRFRSVVTSYDYNAPLSEAGDPTEKLLAIRDVIKRVSLRESKIIHHRFLNTIINV